MNEGQVDAIYVRSLLSIHQDGDVPLVEQPPDLLILKGVPRHHVAPVTAGVADGTEDQLVLIAAPLDCLLAPWIPECNERSQETTPTQLVMLIKGVRGFNEWLHRKPRLHS